MGGSDIASSCSVLRSRRPQTRLEASCTRTGRPRRRLLATSRRTAGEGLGRKARMNVTEESDSGVLAELLRGNQLTSVYHGEHGMRTMKELGRSYLTITKDLTRVMSRIKALYRSW